MQKLLGPRPHKSLKHKRHLKLLPVQDTMLLRTALIIIGNWKALEIIEKHRNLYWNSLKRLLVLFRKRLFDSNYGKNAKKRFDRRASNQLLEIIEKHQNLDLKSLKMLFVLFRKRLLGSNDCKNAKKRSTSPQLFV